MFKMPLPPDLDYDEQADLTLPDPHRAHLQRRFGAGPGNSTFGPPLPSSTFDQVKLDAVQPSQASKLAELRKAKGASTQTAKSVPRGRSKERKP